MQPEGGTGRIGWRAAETAKRKPTAALAQSGEVWVDTKSGESLEKNEPDKSKVAVSPYKS